MGLLEQRGPTNWPNSLLYLQLIFSKMNFGNGICKKTIIQFK